MKHNWLIAGLVILGLIFSFTFIGCKSPTSSNPDDPGTLTKVEKKLKITGITGVSSSHIVVMLKTVLDLTPGVGTWGAGGNGNTADTVTIQLKNVSTPNGMGGYNPAINWTGTGEYYIALWETSGGNFSGLPSYYTPQKFNFDSETTIVEWDKFIPAASPGTEQKILAITGLETARAGKKVDVMLFTQEQWDAQTMSTAMGTSEESEQLSDDEVPLFYTSDDTEWKGAGIFVVLVNINGDTTEHYKGTVAISQTKTTVAFSSFTKIDEGASGDSVTINIAAIEGVTPPVAGAIPVTTITETDQYTGTVSWNGNPGSFVASTVYTATITLTAKAGYTLTGVRENFFTVDGTSTLATNAVDSGVITAVFPNT